MFPYVFYFPLIPWCTLGHASSPWQEALRNGAVELSPSHLVCTNYLLASVKDTGRVKYAVLDDHVLWDVANHVWIHCTHIWCVLPAGTRDSPSLLLLRPWVSWLMHSTCRGPAAELGDQEGAMSPAPGKNWLTQLQLTPWTLASLTVSNNWPPSNRSNGPC